MNTFKVGDKVRLTSSGLYNFSNFKVGDTFIIEEIDGEDKKYLRSIRGLNTGVHYTYCELVEEFKVGDLVTFQDVKLIYKITYIKGDIVKLLYPNYDNTYRYENIKDIKLYNPNTSFVAEGSIFKTGDLIKEGNNVYKVTNNTNVAFNIHTGIKIEIDNNSNFKLYEHGELAKHVNYYFDNDGNEKQRQAFNVKGNNLNPDVLTDEQTYTLINNNNTMEKLNLILSKEFFDNKKNVKDIIHLNTLLIDSAELITSTEIELQRIKLKLNGLSRKLESATNNQDVALLKDLISSTKVIQEFVDELRGKTISKFENAKTKFDVAGYLKD